MTESPLGDLPPGEMTTPTLSRRRQSAVRAWSAAWDRAGVELAPVAASTPAREAAVASASGKRATKARASARST